MLRGKFEAPELRRKAKEFYNKHKHNTIHDVRLRHMYIEDKSSGSSLIQDLKSEGFSIRAIQRNTDKVSRSHDTSPYIEQGRVYLNKNVPSIDDLESEARGFPNAKHDDTLDPMMDAIDIAFIGSGSSAVAAMMA
jgi:predicted phage terminase large subunit-like protein